MREFSKYLPALIVCVLSFIGIKLLTDNGDRIADSIIDRRPDCNFAEDIGCLLTESLYRLTVEKEVLNLAYTLGRRSISKGELPNLRIYMDGAAIAKLQTKRMAALDKHRPLLITEPDSWVKATIVAEGAHAEQKAKVSLRLKGDFGDHLRNPRKVSFRIKTRAGGHVFGLKRFSIQSPTTRKFETEPLLLNHMREHGVLGPRYQFVFVYVNDLAIGVMGLEEHMSKEMLEAQARREGPILAYEEDMMWNQREIQYNVLKQRDPPNYNYNGLRDAPIKVFNNRPYAEGSIATNNTARGQAQLRDFYDGKIPAGETFDFPKLSKWWILTNIWGGCHAVAWHNRRYYFNPISGLLEPIAFDNWAKPTGGRLCNGDEIQTALRDPKFISTVRNDISSIRQELATPEFIDRLKSQKSAYRKILDLEKSNLNDDPISVDVLVKNLSIFEGYFLTEMKAQGDNRETTYQPVDPSFSDSFLAADPIVTTHFTASYFPLEDSGVLEFRNLTFKDIKISSIKINEQDGTGKTLGFGPVVLPSSKTLHEPISFKVAIAGGAFDRDGGVTAEYTYKGQAHRQPVRLQFRNYDSGFPKDFLTGINRIRSLGARPEVLSDKKQLVFGRGVYDIYENLELPEGWAVLLAPGVNLTFVNGAVLKIQGPLHVDGTADEPVRINITSNTSYRQMGSWGGFLVSRSKTRSRISHLILTGNGDQNLANRQDYHGLTGCLTFNASDVDIADSTFKDAHCEDALNIVSSNFVLDRVAIVDTRADAFDSDFSTGIVRNSMFTNSGNDGVDISGTILTLNSVNFVNSGDKAISVGEGSTLQGKDLNIDNAVIGVASKDLSTVQISKIKFNQVSGSALMAYVKKPEYGPASIKCDDCEFADAIRVSTRQEGTTILVNGETAPVHDLTEAQMRHVGILE